MDRLTRRNALALMVLCLLVAAALRLPHLATLPPGLHYDEAANVVLIGDIALRGERPIFIPSYTGKEVLFFYLAAGLARALGNTVFSMRLTSAFVGLLTVAATYWLGREMLADRRVGLVAAALLAVSFWHVLFSHLGFRVISEPLLQALTVAALFRGLRTNRWGWFVAAGVLLGLTAYTYLAARLFPVLLLLALLPLLFDRPRLGARWSQLLLMAAVAFIVVLPLAGYFVAHPEAFWTRIEQVGGAASSELSLGASYLKSLGMFFLVGDPYLRFNLPRKPLFDFFWGALLLVGWVVGAARLRRLPYDWQRSAVVLLLAAPLIMLLPTALAVNEIVPSNIRALGMIPFIFFLPAIGLVTLLHDIERRLGQPSVAYAVQFIVVLLLVGGGALTAVNFYRDWGQQRELVLITDGDLTAAAPVLDARLAQIPVEQRPQVYVAAPHYRHPTLAALSQNYDALKWLPQSQAIVIPATGSALYLYTANSPLPTWAAPVLEGSTATNYPPTGDPLFTLYEQAEPPQLTQPATTIANFENTITLDGVSTGTAAAGETLPVTLTWHVEQPLAPGSPAWVPYVHLEDQQGFRWSQAVADAYPSEQWAAGDTILQRVEVDVPAGTPPGNYVLRVGLFEPGSGRVVTVVDEAGAFAGTAASIDDVTLGVGAPPKPLPSAPQPLYEIILNELLLMGYERPPRTAESGQPGALALWWMAKEALPALSLRLSLVDGQGATTVLFEGQPVYDTYPFAEWATPQFIIDRQAFTFPEELASGEYDYRLEVLDGSGATLHTADLGSVTVEKTERLFTPPPIEHPLDAQFGDSIRLLGYDLGEGRDPGLTLVWQAADGVDDDYTVFVHLLYPDGTCCAWQSDAMPQGNAYPTSRWLPGEVVVDALGIVLPEDAPPGDYALEVGLYRPETGARLGVVVDGQPQGDALRLGVIGVP